MPRGIRTYRGGRKTASDKQMPSDYLYNNGETRVSTSIPWGGNASQEEFNNVIYQSRQHQMVQFRDRQARNDSPVSGSHSEARARRQEQIDHDAAVRANRRQFGEDR